VRPSQSPMDLLAKRGPAAVERRDPPRNRRMLGVCKHRPLVSPGAPEGRRFNPGGSLQKSLNIQELRGADSVRDTGLCFVSRSEAIRVWSPCKFHSIRRQFDELYLPVGSMLVMKSAVSSVPLAEKWNCQMSSGLGWSTGSTRFVDGASSPPQIAHDATSGHTAQSGSGTISLN
jgi:hypothetical protein